MQSCVCQSSSKQIRHVCGVGVCKVRCHDVCLLGCCNVCPLSVCVRWGVITCVHCQYV